MRKVSLLLALGILLGGCMQNTTQTNEDETMLAGEEQQTDEKMVGGEAGVEEGGESLMEEGEDEVDYTIDLASFSFTPSVLTVDPGQTLRIKLVNVGGVHDFVLDELKVKSKQLKEGEEEVIEIEVPENSAGKSYEFYCSVGNHRAMGMVGTLEVSSD